MTARPLIPPFSGILSVVCSKCTKQGRFAAPNLADAAEQAKAKGWSSQEEGRYMCPRCSSIFGAKRD